MRRREFLGAAGVLAAGVATRRTWAPRLQDGTPLHVPPEVRPDGLVLTARPGDAAVDAVRHTEAWMYNGSLPGPTMRLARGERARVTLVNALPESHITHWHGLLVPEVADGHPRLAVPPGGRYEYDFTVDQWPGLHWYHPHTHMRTGYQVHRGLAGFFIVEDPTVRDPDGLPPRERELLLVLQDRTIAADGTMPVDERGPVMMAGYFGNEVLVNGTAHAVARVTPDLWRLRILNGSAARIYDLDIGGLPLAILGSDGGWMARPAMSDHLLLAPAERLDLLVDFSGAAGRSLAVRSRAFTLPAGTRGPMAGMGRGMMGMMMGRQGEAIDVMRLEVAADAPRRRALPRELASRPVPALPRGAIEQRFVFSTMMMSHTINGQDFAMERANIRARAGSVERWTFVNDGPFPHPVHLHAAHFAVRERRGGRAALLPHEHGWKDTVLVAPSEEVTVDVHFAPHRGRFLLHCHNLQHEDMGMMLNVDLD